jgi:hypothetical protein
MTIAQHPKSMTETLQVWPTENARLNTKNCLTILASAGIALLIVFFGMKINQKNLKDYLYVHEDTFLIMSMVKGTIENGHHWENPRLGAPSTQQLYDFPVIDHLHFGIIRILRCDPDF